MQKLPPAAATMLVVVTSGPRLTGRGARNVPGLGGQSSVVSWLPTGVHARPTFGPALQVPETHFGHGEVALPVRNTRDDRLMLMTASPVEGVTVPLASVTIALTTQVLRPLGFRTGSGGPKKQLASLAHEPGDD